MFSKVSLFLSISSSVWTANAWTSCNGDDGGDYSIQHHFCPSHNFCCPAKQQGTTTNNHIANNILDEAVLTDESSLQEETFFYCISGSAKRPWNTTQTNPCCATSGTGCPPGYRCSDTNRTCLWIGDDVEEQDYHSQRLIRSVGNVNKMNHDPPSWLPQYKLCSIQPDDMKPQALEIIPGEPKLLYFSALRPGTRSNLVSKDKYGSSNNTVHHALIVVHGSGLNADDYLCGGLSSVPAHLRHQVVVISPSFLPSMELLQSSNTAQDNGNSTTGTAWTEYLRWNDKAPPMAHSFRYGANAINSRLDISSYYAMDRLVEHIMDHYPRLQSVIVAGHSAGGQFTHRWALTSSAPLWQRRTIAVRVVPTNPRSFCYLDGRRFVRTNNTTGVSRDESSNNKRDLKSSFSFSFRLPSEERIDACPYYNSWEWGLDRISNSRLGPMPYIEQNLLEVGGIEAMVRRYAERNVWYLAGELDVLPLESECEDDDFQGPNRRERSRRFYQSMRYVYADLFNITNSSDSSSSNNSNHHSLAPLPRVHQRVVAKQCPHNHALMFQSAAGQRALWGHIIETRSSTTGISMEPFSELVKSPGEKEA